MAEKNLIKISIFGLLLILLSSFSVYAGISFAPLETIDEGNYEIELVQDNYIIYSDYMKNRDNINKNNYYFYNLNTKEKIELGEFSSKTTFLEKNGVPYYFEIIEPSKFSKNNLKKYIVNIGQFDFSNKKFNLLFNKESEEYLGFTYTYYKTKEQSYIFSFSDFQDLEFNNDTKLYELESEFLTSLHLSNDNVTKISKQDVYNLKEKGFYFENDNFLIKELVILNKDTSEFHNLKNVIKPFCGIKDNIIYRGGTHYVDQTRKDVLIEFDYILNKDVKTSFVNGSCIRSDNLFFINNSLYNYNKNEVATFEINKPIIDLLDNKIIAKNNKGIYFMSFSEFSVDYGSLNKFINDSLKFYSHSTLDDLVVSLNSLDVYYSNQIISDNQEITQSIQNIRTELNKLRQSCGQSNLNQNQNTLCKEIIPYFDQIDTRYYMDLNIDILYVKPITENLFETQVYIEYSDNSSINTTFKQEIKLNNNKYLITNLSKKFFFENNENLSLVLSELNQNFSSYATPITQKSNQQLNSESEKDGNGFLGFIFFLIICASVYYGGKFILNNISKNKTLICPHCETHNEVKLSNNEISYLKYNPLNATCHKCNTKINIDSSNISKEDFDGIKNNKKEAHLSSIQDLETKLDKEYSKEYNEKSRLIEQKHIIQSKELEEKKKKLTSNKFNELKQELDEKHKHDLEVAKNKLDKEQSKKIKEEVAKMGEESQLAFKEKIKQEKQFKKQYEAFRDDLYQFKKKGNTAIIKYVEYCFNKYENDFDLKDLSNAIKEIEDKKIPVSTLQGFLDKEIKKQEKKKDVKRYTMGEIDSMSGDRFEELLSELFKKLDFTNVKVTQGSHDGGTDLIAHKDSKKYIIQAKRYKLNASIGVSAIQEIISCEREHKADEMMVITTAEKYSNDAKRKAKENNVELWNRIELKEKLSEVNLI